MDDNQFTPVGTRKRRIGATLYAVLKSRSGWKGKVAELRKTIKSQNIELRDVRLSREKWKSNACELRNCLSELEAEAARLREQLGTLKKGAN